MAFASQALRSTKVMRMAKWTIVSADDWQMLYEDGHKVLEGHSLQFRDVLALMDIECDFREDTDVNEFGGCGAYDTLAEYPEGALR